MGTHSYTFYVPPQARQRIRRRRLTAAAIIAGVALIMLIWWPGSHAAVVPRGAVTVVNPLPATITMHLSVMIPCHLSGTSYICQVPPPKPAKPRTHRGAR